MRAYTIASMIMSARRKAGGQATPIKGRRPAAPAVSPRKVVSSAGQQVSGIRRDLLRYVDFHPALFLLTGGAILALVCVIYLGQVTAVTNANYNLQKLQSDYSGLLRDKENLQLQIARAQSLPNIEKVARDRLHMVPIGDKYEYITVAPGPIGVMKPPAPQDNRANP